MEETLCLAHVHLCVNIPSKLNILTFMGYWKEKSVLMIYDMQNKALWARGYCVATTGNAAEEAIKKYITEQSEESGKENSEGVAF